MAGVLFRVFIPTCQYENRLRESMKTKTALENAPNLPSINEMSETLTKVESSSKLVLAKDTDKISFLAKPEDCRLSMESMGRDEDSEALVQNTTNDRQVQNKIEDFSPKPSSKDDVPTSDTRNSLKKHLKEMDSIMQDEATCMEKAVRNVLKNMNIMSDFWCLAEDKNYYQVLFSLETDSDCEKALQQFEVNGIGYKMNSVVSVTPCSLLYQAEGPEGGAEIGAERGEEGVDDKKEQSEWEKFLTSVSARLTVAQVVQGVTAGASLTFDFLALLLVAGFLAALGLVENSTVILVASMLISPLMGPIMAGTFGTVIEDKQLQRMGFRNELLGLLTCLLIGYLFGFLISLSTDHWGDGNWPTNEMVSRGMVRSLWVGVLIALFSGAGVAISTLADYTGSLVGVAISASLLPPAVNAGLLWSLACTDILKGTSSSGNSTTHFVYSQHRPSELAILGTISMCLTLLNILCIFIAGIIVLKIKAVAPRTTVEDRQFWRHDVKIAKDYNWTWNGEDAKELRRKLLNERSLVSNPDHEFSLIGGRSSGPFQYPHEMFNPYRRGVYGQTTWSPCTNSLPRDHIPSMRELETLYETLTGSSRPKRPSLRRGMSAGPYWPSSVRSPSSPTSKKNAPSFPTGSETSAVMPEPPKRPQRFRSARFKVTRADDPLLEA